MSDALATRPSKRPRISYGEGQDDDDATSTPASNTQHDNISDMTEAEPARIGSNRRRTCGWADLPGELRNQIYELCLVPSTSPIGVRSVERKGMKNRLKWMEMRRQSPTDSRWPELRKLRPTLNLLRINKATYAEGSTYLYSNEFYFFTSKDLSIFLKHMSAAQKLVLRNISLEIPSLEDAISMGCGLGIHEQSNFILSGLQRLEGAINLKTLQLILVDSLWSVRLASEWSLEWLAAEVYKKAHRWLQAISAQKGSSEKAVDLINVKGISRPLYSSDSKLWRYLYKGFAESNSEDTSLLRKELVKRMQ
ncbi:Short-chain dehydrogenase reductase sdr protein [Lasiodiplodia theobromae]|uniref:Short-chain dehydrogenase reductase sdr protein n=1 Tax=Lasiodiplodia theobromae TaxID=45133 RepID=UPI0015C3D597|nr:Short-chain dehydrogenase reductase sdr protein [Lasiodiplodia theobromae]KAF4536383.1 Short-chain dehydrogenase reductase sdr protein [Lasiodiplodia theobromae]